MLNMLRNSRAIVRFDALVEMAMRQTSLAGVDGQLVFRQTSSKIAPQASCKLPRFMQRQGRDAEFVRIRHQCRNGPHAEPCLVAVASSRTWPDTLTCLSSVAQSSPESLLV